MNDALEIGFWRQRHARVERALALADRLVAQSDATPLLELAAALAEIRAYDAEAWPWRTAGTRREALAAQNLAAQNLAAQTR